MGAGVVLAGVVAGGVVGAGVLAAGVVAGGVVGAGVLAAGVVAGGVLGAGVLAAGVEVPAAGYYGCCEDGRGRLRGHACMQIVSS